MPEWINVPVRDGSPPDADEHEVDVADEYIMEEHMRSQRRETPDMPSMMGIIISME